MAGFGSSILNLLGQQDPRQALLAQALGRGGAPGATPTPAPGAPGTTPAAGTPPQPTALQTPPDLLSLYSALTERSRKESNIDKGIGMIAAGLAQPENRQMIMQNYGGAPQESESDMMGSIMKINEQQQALKDRATSMNRARSMATQLGIDEETAMFLAESGQLDEVIANSLKPPENNDPASVKEYQFYRNQVLENGGTPLDYNTWDLQGKRAGATSVTVGGTGELSKADQDLIGYIDKDLIDVSRPAAQAAVGTMGAVGQARQAFNSEGGLITGSKFAPFENEVRKVLSDVMGIEDPATANQAAYDAALSTVITSRIKELGTGNAISNADLLFTQKSVGAGGEIPEEAIPRILNILELGSYNQALEHNKRVDERIEASTDADGNIPKAVKVALESAKVPVPEMSSDWKASIPTEAIAQLKTNPDDPELRAYFDETFGKGAARVILGK